MRDKERVALETNISRIAGDLHENEKRIAPIKKEISDLETSLSEFRRQNETLITENAGIRAENEQLERQVAATESIVSIVSAERDRARESALKVLAELVLVPSERHKREQMIAGADSIRRIRMWQGVWEAERDRSPYCTGGSPTDLSVGVS